MTYKKVVETMRLDKFYAIPAAERDRLALFVFVKPDNKTIKPADVQLTLVDGAERRVAQSSQAIKKMAGAMSMFAPTIKVVVLRFSKPAQVKVGGKLYSSDAKNEVHLKADTELMEENPLVVASERPFEADLDME